ncbi:MAG: PhzF family phenazine biosynthesis protein [Burkholderiaceae bacterium]|nr:PhzF family phenazine biosynthesis protein [Burkholderiaceae bacterium]
MSRRFPYVTVDVFTDTRFGGNPLAVFTDAQGLTDREMQQLAAEMNYSETTFVLPPADPNHTARVRIFNRTQEMPFAGHPNVGTGCVLASMGRDRDGLLRFEEIAGLVEVRVERDSAGNLVGAHIAAPQPLSVGEELPVEAIAACAGLDASDLVLTRHPPRMASVGLPFCFVQVTPAALKRAAPNLSAFQQLAQRTGMNDRLSLHLHCYAEGNAPNRLRTRMFAPISGTWEDPATGSANAALAAFLLSLGDAREARHEITQGVEMGRPSLLKTSAQRRPDGIHATVGGGCVWVCRGEAEMS